VTGSATLYWTVYCSIEERPVGVHGSAKPVDAIKFSTAAEAQGHCDKLNGSYVPTQARPYDYQVRTHSHQITTAHRRHGGAS
jgi:hypothetical protein